ncbi:Lrp/AsnC family transcriptional regulator [Methanobacterium formicicum]|uniref:AsnC family transcriptional regulator n=1 Tax=Methanobacterium formicicum (strain DSM 3637 / PP1) TaxID=1204725 RepID=K2RAE2_METFP|nr:Lrp/AsnC family transcriptional regulator [Methanobacterium formicicum]EKF85274.1 AsnC family transcriptional regulator [Methanobacterium formicicum DSM 3637]
MDDVDLAILRSLIKNSRITISQMSKEIDIPDATISNRLKKLETDVIKRYTLIPDWQKVGLEITSIIIIQTESERHELVKEELSRLEKVSEVYSVSGEYDILIKVWVKSIEDLNQLINSKIRSIDGVEDLTEMIVMERVKEDIPTL